MTAKEYRAARDETGRSQANLAKILGVRVQTVSERERGVVPISRESELALITVSYGMHMIKGGQNDAT